MISLIGILILMAGNTYNGDYYNYMYFYYSDLSYGDFELGFIILVRIFRLLNINYETFLFFIFSICLCINVLIVKKFKTNIHCVLFLYVLIQLPADTVQYRNYIASTFLLLSLYCNYNKNKVGTLISILVSLSFHRSFIIYLPILFINEKYIKFLIRYGSVFIIILTIIIHFVGGSSFLSSLLINLFSDVGKSGYFNTTTGIGFWLYFILYILNIVLLIYFNHLARNTEISLLLRWCLLINLYICISLPLLTFNMNIYRLYRNLNLFNFICYSKIYTLGQKNILTKKNLKNSMILLTFALIWLSSFIIRGSGLYEFILNNNIIG